MKKNSNLGGMIALAVIVGAGVYVYSSQAFERVAPMISVKNGGYWNLKDPLPLTISDDGGLKSYSVVMRDKSEDTVLYHEEMLTPKQKVELKVQPPKNAFSMTQKEIEIIVEATDASKWGFFNGNKTTQNYKLVIDKRRPEVKILANSYRIKRGGSALVVFQAVDANMKELYIETNFNKKFKSQPFYKNGYHIALIAWPVNQTEFRATVVAKDGAMNTTQVYVPLYLGDANYKVSNIEIKDDFLNGKIAELAEEFAQTQGVSDPVKRFQIINEQVRLENEKLIHEITSKVSTKMINDFRPTKMYPLKNGAVVAYFGDHRIYSYQNKQISESYHLGLDLASNSMAEIRPKNPGAVVFSDYNGLYGNMPILSHGLGLYTLYGHCSSVAVQKGDVTKADQLIANTGKSGYAMGDHVHFGVLVQGIEVYPAEWMDDNWIKLNITDIIDSSKKMIDSNTQEF